MALGNKLKELLNERNLTVKEFAKMIHVAPTTLYSFIKRDSSDIKTDLLMKICNALNIDMFDLLEIESEPLTDEEFKVLEKDEMTSHSKISTINGDVFVSIPVNKKLMNMFPLLNDLNDNELERLSEYADFIKSQRKDTIKPVNAAHAIAGASEEDKQNDEDIMNDDDF